MNKRILISLSVIAAVAAIAIGGTVAYFSDTETSKGNTFSTGVIDITVEPGTKWSEGWDIIDMKPCETGYINFVIHNPGKNPVNVWKTIKNITTSDEPVNEPECVYNNNGYYGVWDPNSPACDIYHDVPWWQYVAKSNLQDWMYYDLSVKVPIPENSDKGWWQTIYKDSDHVTVGDISGKRIFLGMVPAGKTMEVTQSYHLQPETGNWAQADTMTFDIEIYAEQLRGELVLENKSGAPDWQILGGDEYKATLTYNLTGPTFDYSLTGKVTLPNIGYSLIYYADPWPGNGEGHNTGALIGTFTSESDGKIPLPTSGSINLNKDLPQWPSDQNHPEGAKIWLVPSTDYGTNHDFNGGTTWNPVNYLFETALITYDDTNN